MKPARTIISVAIALFMMLGAVGTLGVSAAQEVPEGVPVTFTWPAPHIGDRGTYTETVIELTQDGYTVLEEEEELLQFEWATPRVEHQADGSAYLANILQVPDGDDPPSWWAIMPGTQDIFGRSFGWYRGEDGLANRGSLTSLKEPGSDGVRVACGLMSPLHGTTFSLDEPQELFSTCAWGGTAWEDTLTFRPIATEMLGDEKTVLFAAETDLQDVLSLVVDDVPPHAYYVWLSESYPYPLRMAYSWFGQEMHVYRLSAFDRGATPLLETTYQASGPMPEATMAMPTQIGLDDAGITHPFKLSDALDIARQDASVSSYMDRYDWRVAFAHGQEYTGVEPRFEWDIELWNERTPFHFTIEKRALDPVASLTGESPYTIERQPNLQQVYPSFALLDQDPRPTVASMWAQWEHVTDAGTPNSYYLQTYCSGDFCERAHVLAWGGRIVMEEDALPGSDPRLVGGMRSYWRYDHWHYYISDFPDDNPIRESESEGYSLIEEELGRGSAPPLLNLGAPTGQSQVPEDAGTLDATAPIWSWPDRPGMVLGAGLIAFGAAAAYYFWPALKTGGIGLFSRVRDPEVLASHPVRRQILDAITASPGAHAAELRRTLSIGAGAFQHHTRKLVDAGLVTRIQQGGYTCHFLKGAADHRVMVGAPALRTPAARAILEAVLAQPGIGAGAAAKTAGVAASTATHHIRRLEEAGLLHATRTGNTTKLVPSEMAKQGIDAIAA